jgi:predicted permease
MVQMGVLIASACPVATTGTMFAIQYDKNPERCSEFFAVTTLLSGLTLPVVTMLGEMWK